MKNGNTKFPFNHMIHFKRVKMPLISLLYPWRRERRERSQARRKWVRGGGFLTKARVVRTLYGQRRFRQSATKTFLYPYEKEWLSPLFINNSVLVVRKGTLATNEVSSTTPAAGKKGYIFDESKGRAYIVRTAQVSSKLENGQEVGDFCRK